MSRTLVTVKSLLAQARQHGAIEIPAETLITPAAADWLRTCDLPVHRLNGSAPPTPTAEPALHMVGDAAHPTCRALLPLVERVAGRLRFLPCHGHRTGLLDAVLKMSAAVSACAQRRGVIVVREGGIVACLANKQPGIRAAVVRRPAQLMALLADLGLNVLIMEHGAVSLRQMAGMIETLMDRTPALDPVVEAAFAEPDAERTSRGNGAAACRCNHAHG